MSRTGNLILVAGIVALVAMPFVVHRPGEGGAEFSGTDGQAEDAVKELRPDYEPWASPVWEPPGGEVETLLFTVQAAAGAAVIGYVIGYRRGRATGGGGPDGNG